MGAKMTLSEKLNKKLEVGVIKDALEKSLRQTMYDLQKAAVREAPVDTGNLRRSFSTEVRIGGNQIEGLLKNSTNYWVFVNFGTSKMDANDFVTRAMQSVQPKEKIDEYFHKFYKPNQ